MDTQPIANTIKAHRAALFQKSNVTSVGCGYHVTKKGKKKTKELGIIVGVTEKLPEVGLMSADVVPQTLDGIPVKVQEVGIIRAHEVDPTARHRPVFPGISVGHYQITAGTIGCVVVKNGEDMILSNNHVLANSNNASIGDPIWQPGVHDGGSSSDQIGSLAHFIPITMDFSGGDPGGGNPTCPFAKKAASVANAAAKVLGRSHRLVAYNPQAEPNKVDAALARLTVPYTKEVPRIGIPTGTLEPILDMPVQKFGRTTLYTTGTVTQIYMTVRVSYGGTNIATFEDQIATTEISAGGDSGSTVYDMNGNLVALLFAGSTGMTICSPISFVLDALDIALPQ